ncbi:S41 family peptidase [bacterium]|nr:S41 family peptidase [bacterium]
MRFRLFGTLLLFTGLVLHTAIFAAEDVHPSTGTVTTLNPLQLEAKFQQAYSRIDERYIEDIQSITFMIGGFKEMLTLAGLENLKYQDIVSPKQRLGSKKDDFTAFRNALQAIRSGTGGKVEMDLLVSAMIRGMVGALTLNGHKDGYSAYLEPEKNRELVRYLKGESKTFGGIGVQIQFKDGMCRVIRPIPDTPAYRAGIRPGDVVIMVDGKEVTTEDEAVDRMKGDPGSRVAVTIRRDKVEEPVIYELTRETISQKELERILLPGKVGYVRLNSFNETSSHELIENLRYLDGLGMKKCILDLRKNSGGLLKSAVEISNVFLPKGSLVVSTRGRQSSDNKEYRTQDNSPYTHIPLVVLVDNYTASAAEIVTGAIRDNRRGKAVGVTTFGKGTVQEVIPLDDSSALKLTIARYYTPSGVCINSTGIKPDYVVEVEEDHVLNPATFGEPSSIDIESLAADLQLKKSLEILGEPLPLPGT